MLDVKKSENKTDLKLYKKTKIFRCFYSHHPISGLYNVIFQKLANLMIIIHLRPKESLSQNYQPIDSLSK